GNVDKLYKEGLQLYWGGYYKDALEKFEGIQRLYPNHSEIKNYISECEKKLPESKTLWSNYTTQAYILDGILIVLIIVCGVFLTKDIINASKNKENIS
ncbi:MAG: hypothetical protein ACRC2K_00590, partial [Clostridium sp.]